MLNGYGPASWVGIFTKASKVLLSHFRNEGFASVVFVDD